MQDCLFPKNCCFSFQLFQVEWKTHMVSFVDNCSTNSRIVCGLRSTYSSSTVDVRREQWLPHNLVSVFQVENVTWKTEQPWISLTSFNRFSSRFHKNYRISSGHLTVVTDDHTNRNVIKAIKFLSLSLSLSLSMYTQYMLYSLCTRLFQTM